MAEILAIAMTVAFAIVGAIAIGCWLGQLLWDWSHADG